MYRSELGRGHAPGVPYSNIVNEEVLARLIDAVLVLIDDVEFDDLERVWTWVGGF